MAEPTVEELDHVVDSLVAVVEGGGGGVGFVAGGGGGGVRGRVEKRGGSSRGGGGEVGVVGSGEEGKDVVVLGISHDLEVFFHLSRLETQRFREIEVFFVDSVKPLRERYFLRSRKCLKRVATNLLWLLFFPGQ